MKLRTILEKVNHYEEMWYDSEWADKVTVHHDDDPVKVIYSQMFRETTKAFPTPIKRELDRYSNHSIFDLSSSFMESFEEFIHSDQPTPAEMQEDLMTSARWWHKLFNVMQKNDVVVKQYVSYVEACQRKEPSKGFDDKTLAGIEGKLAKIADKIKVIVLDFSLVSDVSNIQIAQIQPFVPDYGYTHIIGAMGNEGWKESTMYRYGYKPIEDADMYADSLIVKVYHNIRRTFSLFDMLHMNVNPRIVTKPNTEKLP